MTPHAGRILKVETAYAGWCRLLVAHDRPARRAQLPREIEDHGRAACVLPFDPARRTAVVIRQLRAPPLYAGQPDVLEAIAGLIDDDEPPEAARREAMEEAGLRLAALEHVTTAWPMPGLSTERMDLFLGEYAAADRVAAGGGIAEDHEHIEVIELPLRDLAAMVDGRQEMDMKLIVLMQTLRLRRPELFD